MNKLKQEKGITLAALIIMIVMLIILAGVTINLGTSNIDSAFDSKIEGELKMVQYAVMQQYTKYKTTLNEDNIIYSEDYNDKIQNFISNNYKNVSLMHKISNNDNKYQKYYLLRPTDLVEIGIQDSQYSYIVNYYTGEVMNADVYTTNSGKDLYVKGINSSGNLESF